MSVSSVVSPTISPPVFTGSSEGAASSARVVSPNADPASQPSAASASKAATSTQAPSPNQVAQTVKQMNDTFTQRGQNLYALFEKDKATGIDVVKIVDKDTKETIIQFPSKAILEIAQTFQHSQDSGGQFIHEKI